MLCKRTIVLGIVLGPMKREQWGLWSIYAINDEVCGFTIRIKLYWEVLRVWDDQEALRLAENIWKDYNFRRSSNEPEMEGNSLKLGSWLYIRIVKLLSNIRWSFGCIHTYISCSLRIKWDESIFYQVIFRNHISFGRLKNVLWCFCISRLKLVITWL